MKQTKTDLSSNNWIQLFSLSKDERCQTQGNKLDRKLFLSVWKKTLMDFLDVLNGTHQKHCSGQPTPSDQFFLHSKSTANKIPPINEMRLIQKTDTEALKQMIAQIVCGQEPLCPALQIQLQPATMEHTLTPFMRKNSTSSTNHQQHKPHHHQNIQQKSKFNQYCFKTALKDAAVSLKAFLWWNSQTYL